MLLTRCLAHAWLLHALDGWSAGDEAEQPTSGTTPLRYTVVGPQENIGGNVKYPQARPLGGTARSFSSWWMQSVQCSARDVVYLLDRMLCTRGTTCMFMLSCSPRVKEEEFEVSRQGFDHLLGGGVALDGTLCHGARGELGGLVERWVLVEAA